MYSLATPIKRLIKSALLTHGYDLRRVNPNDIGRDPFQDMCRLTDSTAHPVLFDVGSNIGQTVLSFRKHFRNPVIHAFEPSPATFDRLQLKTKGMPDLHLNNVALGADSERKVLLENSDSRLSSLLEPGKDCWGDIVANTAVEVESLDNYCNRKGVTRIDVLKIDTQGLDYAVLQGGIEMLKHHRVRLLYIELNFCDMYLGQAPFEEIYLFLKNLGIIPVWLYDLAHHNNRLGWADGLFIDPHMRVAS